MKKQFFILATSVLALTACTSEETLFESNENGMAIGFENVISKQMRSTAVDLDAEHLKHFNVFGYYTTNAVTNKGVLVFNNELVSKSTNDATGQVSWNYDHTRYWVPGANYCFYAYSCQDVELNSKFGTFAMDVNKSQQADRTLRITGFICDESHQHDLLFASAENITPESLVIIPETPENPETPESGEGNVDDTQPAGAKRNPVAFKFEHLLSKINCIFTSDFAPEYTVEITNVQVSNIRNIADYVPGKGWINQDRRMMTGNVDPYVLFHDNVVMVAQKGGKITDVAGNETNITAKEPESEYGYVIPYTYTSADVTISFDITVKKTYIDDNGDEKAQVILGRTLKGTWSPTWLKGHHYTYKINITGTAANLDAIMFATDKDPITGWVEGDTPLDIKFSAN